MTSRTTNRFSREVRARAVRVVLDHLPTGAVCTAHRRPYGKDTLMARFSVHDAKTNLSKLIADALEGGEVVIARGNVPLVRLVPVVRPGQWRVGLLKEKLRSMSALTSRCRRMSSRSGTSVDEGQAAPRSATFECPIDKDSDCR